jgi:hypothetical protein
MDETLSLALFLNKSSPLAMSAFALSVLFPRLLLRPLPDGMSGQLLIIEGVLSKGLSLDTLFLTQRAKP